MKKFFLVLALCSAFALQSKHAYAQPLTQCNQGPAQVEVDLDYVPPQEDTTLTAIQIDDKFRNDISSTLASDRRGIYVGVTRSPFKLASNFTFARLSNVKQTCLTVNKATYTFVYHPEVYIASDFMRMACRYGVTGMHEQRHVNAFLQTANEYIPLIKEAAENYIPQMPVTQPIATADADITAREQEIMKEVGESLKPVIEKFEETNRARQAAIDTPENYAHDDAICPGEHPAFPPH